MSAKDDRELDLAFIDLLRRTAERCRRRQRDFPLAILDYRWGKRADELEVAAAELEAELEDAPTKQRTP